MSSERKLQDNLTRGADCLDRGHFLQAQSHFDRVLNIEPENEEGLAGRGVAALGQGQLKHAAKYFEKALQVRPGNHELIWQLCHVYECMEWGAGWSSAGDSYDSYLRHAPETPETEAQRWIARQRKATLERKVDLSGCTEVFLDFGLLTLSTEEPPFRTSALYRVPMEQFREISGSLRGVRRAPTGGTIYPTSLADFLKPYLIELPH